MTDILILSIVYKWTTCSIAYHITNSLIFVLEHFVTVKTTSKQIHYISISVFSNIVSNNGGLFRKRSRSKINTSTTITSTSTTTTMCQLTEDQRRRRVFVL